MSKCVLHLSYPHYDDKLIGNDRISAPRVYRVDKVEQTTIYVPGQQLNKEEVSSLCAANGMWRIIVSAVKE